MKRSGFSKKPAQRSFIPKMSLRRHRQEQQYSNMRRKYLIQHPLCQLTIAYHRLDEASVVEMGVPASGFMEFNGIFIPFATEIHHRNKRSGARLVDRRWFASACRKRHTWVEGNKDIERREGYLLPFGTNFDGLAPSGEQCLATDEWLAERAR